MAPTKPNFPAKPSKRSRKPGKAARQTASQSQPAGTENRAATISKQNSNQERPATQNRKALQKHSAPRKPHSTGEPFSPDQPVVPADLPGKEKWPTLPEESSAKKQSSVPQGGSIKGSGAAKQLPCQASKPPEDDYKSDASQLIKALFQRLIPGIRARAQSACAGERTDRAGRSNLVTAGLLYLIFVLLLVGINLWSPERLTISAGSESLSDLDLTGRQRDFEQVWRAGLLQLGLAPDSLTWAVSNRLAEKEYQGFKLKWIVAVTNLTLPPAQNEAQLIKAATRWKESCAAYGWKVTRTSWGRAARGRGNILWVRLESSARVSWNGRELLVPIQKITVIQPLLANQKKHWNLEGLIPQETPDLTATPTLTTPQPKPTPAATPVPVGSAAPQGNQASPQPTPRLIPTPPATSPPVVTMPRPPGIKTHARVAIIIDDVGYLRGPADELLKVPAPLTWSVLPFTPYSDILVEEGRARGFKIMLHLPLEAIDKKNNPGPGVLRVGWPEDEVRQQLDDDLQAVPGISGINNHMGSAGTSDEALMEILMRYIKEKGLFFIDSETSNHSVAEKYARQYGVPTARRDVFIDNQSSVESKKAQLEELIRIALKNGRAIGIGHTREGTGTAILEMLPEFVKAGVKIVPVSELVK